MSAYQVPTPDQQARWDELQRQRQAQLDGLAPDDTEGRQLIETKFQRKARAEGYLVTFDGLRIKEVSNHE